MNRSENQKLTDEIIGEAVLALLQAKGPVSAQALIAQLRLMETDETDISRQQAIARAVTEVRESISSGRRRVRRDQQDKDNVHPIFGEKTQPDSSKKH